MQVSFPIKVLLSSIPIKVLSSISHQASVQSFSPKGDHMLRLVFVRGRESSKMYQKYLHQKLKKNFSSVSSLSQKKWVSNYRFSHPQLSCFTVPGFNQYYRKKKEIADIFFQKINYNYDMRNFSKDVIFQSYLISVLSEIRMKPCCSVSNCQLVPFFQ